MATSDEQRKEIETRLKEKSEVEEAKKNLPSVEDVKNFILSQPKYRHRTFDIQKHFFGRTFKARGVSEGLYHDFLKISTEARQQIEQEKYGKFIYQLELGRHKVYTWELHE